jgi:colanic acid biosynthesis glycosyl transferase WcaI
MRILILNQAFQPDVAATAQQAGDVASELARRGHAVTVIASQRGYNDPRQRFKSVEYWRGIEILRVGCTAFGKGSPWRRVFDALSFLSGVALRLALQKRFDLVLTLTTPPILPSLASFWVWLRGGRLVLWLMDMNPDQAIAAGWLAEKSLPAAFLRMLQRSSLKRADRVVVLDRFARERLLRKGVAEDKITVIPPWPQDDVVGYDSGGRTAFRRAHGFDDKFVVMYAGNHSPCHPLDTLLEAAWLLRTRTELVFCFAGGGAGTAAVRAYAEQRQLKNVVCLPYQPIERLPALLSSADLQVVVMGDAFVGIVHPCKIYNILRLGIPFLFIGPQTSHVGDLMQQEGCRGFPAGILPHGDVKGVVTFLESAIGTREMSNVVLDGVEGSQVKAVGTKAASETEGCPEMTCP